MRRIGLVVVVALSLLHVPLAAEAQQAAKIPRIGVFFPATPPAASRNNEAFTQGLRELGYVEGQNIAIEWRPSGGSAERLPDLAAELVRLKVDVIVATDNPAIAAAQRATSTIPIVMALAQDPIHPGLTPAARARPIRSLQAQACGY